MGELREVEHPVQLLGKGGCPVRPETSKPTLTTCVRLMNRTSHPESGARADDPAAAEKIGGPWLGDRRGKADDHRARPAAPRAQSDGLASDVRVARSATAERWPEAEPRRPMEALDRPVDVVDGQLERLESDRPADWVSLR